MSQSDRLWSWNWFFLGVDDYRLHKNLKEPDKVSEYKRLSRQVLEEVMKEYPGTMEARAAEALLEGLKEPKAE